MDLAGKQLLIVDDEAVLNLTFAILLRRAGAVVWQAAHGEEALVLMRNEAIDLILCDQAMPVMDGLAFLKQLRTEGRSVPTLLFTNGIDLENLPEFDGMRVHGLLTKPIQPHGLLAAVAEALAMPDKSAT